MIERATIDTDTNRSIVSHGHFDHLGEILDTALALADVARIDSILGKGLCALAHFRQKFMAVVVEVTDQGNITTLGIQCFTNRHHRACSFRRIDRQTDQLTAGTSQLNHLLDRRLHIHRGRIGHRLHANGSTTADRDHAIAITNGDLVGLMSSLKCHF